MRKMILNEENNEKNLTDAIKYLRKAKEALKGYEDLRRETEKIENKTIDALGKELASKKLKSLR